MRNPKKLAKNGWCELCDAPRPMASWHHLLYQRRYYCKGIFRQVRNLPCMQVSLCRSKHDLIHKVNPNPKRITFTKAKEILRRHEEKRCWCYNPPRITLYNLLPKENVKTL